MLTDKLVEWADTKRALNKIEDEITNEMLLLKKSIKHEDVIVKFTKGITKYDYSGIVAAEKDTKAKKDSILKHSTQRVTVLWKEVVRDLGIPSGIQDKFKTVGDPKVKITLVDN